MSWQNEEMLYLVMWRSRKTGATLSDLRKTEAGKNRLVETLMYLGYSEEDIIVTKQRREWKPVKRGGFNKRVGGN